ncbi:hypothetical protein KXR61_06555 [Pseudomonas benzopyrenica]
MTRDSKTLSTALPTVPFIHHIAQGLGYSPADPRHEVAIEAEGLATGREHEAANVLRVPVVPINNGGTSQLGTMPIHFHPGYSGGEASIGRQCFAA